MAEYEKWIEQIKDRELYSPVDSKSNLSKDILDEWAVNSLLNLDMARQKSAYEFFINGFPEPYRTDFLGLFNGIVTCNKAVDGWAIDKAIQAEGQAAAGERGNMEKKEGFLSKIFGGKKDESTG